MVETALGEITQNLDAELRSSSSGNPLPVFPDVSIDSRTIRSGQCFIAIKGVRFDGHDFVKEAIEKGARVVVHSRVLPLRTPPGVSFLRVRDTTIALQKLGAFLRKKWGGRLIGITGSMGKTTTRAFMATLLREKFKVCESRGNLNNDIGLPLSLCRLREEHQWAVVEMGMNHSGEIGLLAQLATPDVAVLTNVAPVHLEFFDSVSDIADAKAEILQGLSSEGLLVFNGDDPELARVVKRHQGPVHSFGMDLGQDFVVRRLRSEGFSHMDISIQLPGDSIEANLPFVGRHYLYNVVAAVSTAHALGLEKGQIERGLASLRPLKQRGRIERLLLSGGLAVQVMDESYNSNPAALSSVLRDLGDLRWNGRKVVVLGGMLELGEQTLELHQQAGREVSRSGIEILITVGEAAVGIAAGAIDAGMATDAVVRVENAEKAAEVLASKLRNNDFILVKASRGIGLEVIARNLQQLSKGGGK
jgi:UDP-N-acetylmuramoyl-tripeptide--D-alanyl-D-alanine ligase